MVANADEFIFVIPAPSERRENHFSGMKAFGQRGAGVFIGPTVLESEIEKQYGVKTLGRTQEIVEEFFAISVERRVTHPSVVAITAAAKDRLFVTSDDA